MADPVTQTVDGVSFSLLEGADFSWLRDLGRVFRVFDQQDSGNIAFGVERDGKRSFVKYAGARTVNYRGAPRDAVATLRAATQAYRELAHPVLIPMLEELAVPGGFAIRFDWFPGESLHPHWEYPPPRKYTDPGSPFYRFRRLPMANRLEAYRRIVEFHAFVERSGYVAIDFYDGCLLYDFPTDRLGICDIDFYRPRPYRNSMGRLWGSTRFMAPEEFALGAEIDERTNVYGMGAMAFCLLGGERDRTIERWEAGPARYAVARRAVCEDRAERYPSVGDYLRAWSEAS